MNMTRTIAAVLSLAALSAVGAAQTAVDKAIPPYKAAKGVSGKIKVAGSDSMAEEVAHWQQGFKVFYPAVITEAIGITDLSGNVWNIAGSADRVFGPVGQ